MPRMGTNSTLDLSRVPLHLGLGATIVPQEPMDGDMAWFQRYSERHASDGTEGRLVTLATFTKPWAMWEMHPNGHELVLCIAGRVVVHQERDGVATTVPLEPHQAAINEPGVWHTADVDDTATVLFITAGVGTQHRPR